MKKLVGFTTLVLSLFFGAFGCEDGQHSLPIGDFCGASDECAAGLCSYGRCLDPLADDDNDGLSNALEAALGSNPFNPDTDGDGILDKDEVGPNGEPIDTDGDGIPDILESAILDKDGDCLPDQYDPDDEKKASAEELQAWGQYLCRQEGVCEGHADAIIVSCDEAALVSCDYSAVPDYAEDELCDGLDNNCDGRVDEGHPDMDQDGVADCVDPDRDGDGVENEADNCPDVPNADQWDANGNGKGDACDPPFVPSMLGFSPSSPGSGPHLQLLGEGEAFSITKVYGDALCEDLLGSVEVNEAREWALDLDAVEGENVFYLRAENRYQLESSCVSGGMTYLRDESVPPSPRFRRVSAIDWDRDEEGLDERARFLIEGEISEARVRVLAFSDADCTEAVGEGRSDEDGHFQIESDWIEREGGALYIASETEARVLGECMPTQTLFGELLVPLKDRGGNLRGGIPVQIHYPDGSPASEVRLSSAGEILRFESFLAGSTVTLMPEPSEALSWRKELSTFATIVPGETFHFPVFDGGDSDPGDVEPGDGISEDYSLRIFWPETNSETRYVQLFFPGGGYSIYALGTNTAQSWVNPRHFQGEDFDLMLVALDEEYQPLAYVLKEGLSLPEGSSELEVDLSNESWQEEGWIENELRVDLDGYYEGSLAVTYIGRNQEVLGGLSQMNFAVDPGEHHLRFKSPPLPGLRVHLLLTLLHEMGNDEGYFRFWMSEKEGLVLPLELGLDSRSDMFPSPQNMGLEVFQASDGLRQIEASFQYSGSFETADLLVLIIQENSQEEGKASVEWYYYMRGDELGEILLPRLSLAWESYLGNVRSLPSQAWVGALYAFEFFTKRPFPSFFRELPFNDLSGVLDMDSDLQKALLYMARFFE